MNKYSFLSILWLLDACSSHSGVTDTPPPDPLDRSSDSKQGPGESIVAPAPRGMSINDLGRPFTRDFVRLQGTDGSSIFPKAGAARRTAQHAFEHSVETIDSWEEWAVHAAAWGLGADIGSAHSSRFASYRAMQIDEVYEIDDATSMSRAPRHAVYYPWRIYMGRSYEVILRGSADHFHAGARASLPVFSGKIDDFVQRYQLEQEVKGRGLRPSRDGAMFAKTAKEIEASYTPTMDEPVPILVEWRRIPGREGHIKTIEWTTLATGCAGEPGCEICRRWSFDRIEVIFPRRKRDGREWDADGSAPDTVLSLRVLEDVRVSTKREVYKRTWTLTPPVMVPAGEDLLLRAIDSDLVADDPMFVLRAEVPDTLDGGHLEFGSGTAIASGHCIDPVPRRVSPARHRPTRGHRRRRQ